MDTTRLAKRELYIENEFANLDTWEEKYKRIIHLGKELPALSESFHDEKFKVRGCQSQVWLHAELTPQGEIQFFGDSDALIVKGLVALLLKLYNPSRPDEILNHPLNLLKRLGLEEHLSASRANGFYSMVKQVILYAQAFKALNR